MLWADLVDLRGQEAAKDLIFNMNPFDHGITNGSIKNNPTSIPKGTTFRFDPNRVDYTLPVGEVVGIDLFQVDQHPFHIHINPFQLTSGSGESGSGESGSGSGSGEPSSGSGESGSGSGSGEPSHAEQWEIDWFQSGDWHDTLFNPDSGTQRVLMQTDFFTGATVVHCHILMHEDDGMMVQVNFTGVEGSRYKPAYGDNETCRVMDTCTTSLIDRKCYSSSKKVEYPTITTPSTCPPASPTPSPPSPSPPPSIDFKEPDEYSCETERKTSGKSSTCSCDKSDRCTLSVTLVFGHVAIPMNNTGLNGTLHMLGFNTPGEDGPAFEVGKVMYVNGTSPGPTLRVRAGDTLRILLINNMPPELVHTGNGVIPQGSHSFDVVNLHTHGLHVSPRAPGDDVINTVVPAHKNHPYEYHIPDDHMGGTHWYHPHWHGAVSIHVNFGAAGMIVVEDAENQLPLELRHKDSSTGNVIMEDHIVAAFHVDFKDITDLTNEYVKNCICLDKSACKNCGLDGTTNTSKKIPSNCTEFNVSCVLDQQNCKMPSNNTISCAKQAAPFFVKPEGYTNTDELLLVNGQLEPTLNITANTWVRLRLGFMATGKRL